jgi:hypothetical protein
MRTVQEEPPVRAVTPDTQSLARPLWIANSLLLGVIVIAPLVSCPLFEMVKL